MLTLYDYELSTDCHQARLLLAILGLPYERVEVELYPSRQHESAWFRQLSPLSRLPVLLDDDVCLADPRAILTDLATRYDPGNRWCPREPASLVGECAAWLGFANTFAASSGRARLVVSFGLEGDLPTLRAAAHRELRVLDDHLWFGEHEGRDWLCSSRYPTIADIALFPDVALSEEGGVSRLDYPAVRRWIDRVKRIENLVEMSGIFPA
jgi:glutathione S-transferase